MGCLVENYVGDAAKLPSPGVGDFTPCNLYDPSPGSGSIIFKINAIDCSETINSTGGYSTSLSLMLPEVSFEDRFTVRSTAKWVEDFKCYRISDPSPIGSFYNAEKETGRPKYGETTGVVIYRSPSATNVVPVIVTYRHFVSDNLLRPKDGQFGVHPYEHGITTATADYVLYRADNGAYIGDSQFNDSRFFEIGDGLEVSGSAPTISFRKGWCLYNPGYIQQAL